MTRREDAAANATNLARRHQQQNTPYDWFEQVYARAGGNGEAVPWAHLAPRPDVVRWLDDNQVEGGGRAALVIGCGLGDDAEELARRGFNVTAFDVSETAIEWCRTRFPDSSVTYRVADLFNPPPEWANAFDFVLEYFVIQSLPPEMNRQTIEAVARFVAPGGSLLAVSLVRDPADPVEGPPWPLTPETLDQFKTLGLTEVDSREYDPHPDSSVRRFMAHYRA